MTAPPVQVNIPLALHTDYLAFVAEMDALLAQATPGTLTYQTAQALRDIGLADLIKLGLNGVRATVGMTTSPATAHMMAQSFSHIVESKSTAITAEARQQHRTAAAGSIMGAVIAADDITVTTTAGQAQGPG